MASISKVKDQIARMKSSASVRRIKSRQKAVVHTMIATGAGYTVGRIEKAALTPLPTVFNLDPKLLWGGVLHLMATGIAGNVGDFAAAAGDGLLSAYGYAEGKGIAMAAGPTGPGGLDEFNY
jgi:hypothetical protein